MAYVSETISEEDQQKVMNDAEQDGSYNYLLKPRGIGREDYFKTTLPELRWAIDREKGYYLFNARTPAVRNTRYFLFYYENRMHLFVRKFELAGESHIHKGYFKDDVDDSSFLKLKVEINIAYNCHEERYKGIGKNKTLELNIFNKEEQS